MYWYCQAGILEALVSVADVKITMTLGDHDSKGSAIARDDDDEDVNATNIPSIA